MKQYTKELIGLVLFFIAIWAVATFFLEHQKNAVSEHDKEITDQEKNIAPDDLSDLIEGLIFSEIDSIHHPGLQLGLDTILNRLTKADPDSTAPAVYELKVIQHPEINAFATLNGKMYLTSGLIRASTSPEVIAAVVAHEMGHIKYEHFKKRLQRELGLQTIAAILTGGNQSLSTELGKSIMQSHYSREQEADCDAFAADLLEKANIHPHRLSESFLVIKNNARGSSNQSSVSKLFHSHPSLKQRIKDNMAIQVDSSYTEQAFELNWNLIKRLADLEPDQ